DQLGELAPGWADAFDGAVAQFRALGFSVAEVDIDPLLTAASMLYGSSFVAERYAAVGEHIVANPDLIGADLDPTVAGIVLAGRSHTADALFNDFAELNRLGALGREALSGVDVLLTPTTTWHPTIEQVQADPVLANSRMGRFTNFCNLLDMASLAFPSGFVGGLPFGVMLTGPAFSDPDLARVARAFLAPELEIMVVGAHLSGQPLNSQLVVAGGSWVADVATAEAYRLYALDTTPPKPGLVRVDEGGHSVVGEVWRLPAEGFGRFVAALPAPMAIGKVELADGRSVSGFVVEPFAVQGAADITSFGGWRAYLARP
ncbi:MAG: amidase family protein, partial [Micropruina sp.]